MKQSHIHLMLVLVGRDFTIWIPKPNLKWNLVVNLLCLLQHVLHRSSLRFACSNVVNLHFICSVIIL